MTMFYNDPNDMWQHHQLPDDIDPDDAVTIGCLQGVGFVVMFIIALAICAMFSSCTTTKYVTVPEYHTDTLIVTQHQRDSIHVHDSIHVTERGDTVRIETWHTKYVEREVHDTLYQSKTDSIPYPVPVIQEVPAQLTWWQEARLHISNILLYLLGLLAAYWLIKKKLLP